MWRVELLDLQSNGSRRWPATTGTVDFGPIELPWLREVLKGKLVDIQRGRAADPHGWVTRL